MDLLLDLNVNDLVFINGPLTLAGVTQPFVQTVQQRLYIRLKTFRGDWHFNTAYGVPYFDILGRKVTKQKLDLTFQEQILGEVGVKEIVSFTSTFRQRVYTLNFKVKCIDGSITDTLTVTPTT